jgi:hypothetical protein
MMSKEGELFINGAGEYYLIHFLLLIDDENTR